MTKNITPEYEIRKRLAGSLLADWREKSARINEEGDLERTTQEDIAGRANLTSKRVFQWEKGDLPSKRNKLVDIVRAYQYKDRRKANEFLQALHLPPMWYVADLSDDEWRSCRSTEPAVFAPAQFQAGIIKLSLIRMVGGDGQTRYTYPDGISTVFHNTQLVLPQRIHDNYNYLLDMRKRESAGAVFKQRNMVRLDDYEIMLSDPGDAPCPLLLHVSLTNYFDMMVTNRSLDTILAKDNATLREDYAADPLELRNSILANPLAVNLSLVTSKDCMIYVARRGYKVATNSNGWGPAVSGTGNSMVDLDESRQYNPFITAQREAYEEVTQPYRPDKSEITIFGLARTLGYCFPFLFGELRLNMCEDDLRSFIPQDNWETIGLVGIPFTIDEVVAFMKKLNQEMTANDKMAIGTTIFSLYESLIYQYPDQRMEILKMLLKS